MHAGRPQRQELMQTGGPYRKVALTDKGTLQTNGPYIQEAPTDIQIRGLYSKGPL